MMKSDENIEKKPLNPIAKQALEEAEARRLAQKSGHVSTEIGGRNGPDPVRFGDWESKGITSDF